MGRPKCFERDEVLGKAIQLFWKKGFADTSLHDLETATGVNKSGLYSEFKDKDDIFVQALKKYAESSQALNLLQQDPPGRKNIESFLLAAHECSGQKGCFLANSLREFSIIPKSAETLIRSQMSEVFEAMVRNVAAESSGREAKIVADLILTYNSGLALRANIGEVPELKKHIKKMLDLVLG